VTDGLFGLPDGYTPPPPKVELTRGQQYHRRIAKRIGSGEHPLGGGIRLHPDAPHDLDAAEAKDSTSKGPRCGGCQFRVQVSLRSKRVPKCHLPHRIGDRDTYPRDTASETSDIAAWWPACGAFKAKRAKR
jgi:hypothetical protein